MINNKNRLFEVMKYLNPETKKINERDEDNLSGDVKHINNVKTAALKTAQSRINTQAEFNDAFTYWFESLGVGTDEYKNVINITTSISHITDVMKKKVLNFNSF